LVTAPPTARLTTNPTRGGVSSSSRLFMCTTRVRRPARSPRRIATAKSSPRRIRDPDGNTEDLPMDLGQVRLSPGRHRQRCRKRTGDEACLGGEDRGPSRGDRQTASLARPLRRRAAMIARPARVRMRSRKPWVLARRRLSGWYVRLLTASLQGRAGSTYDANQPTVPRSVCSCCCGDELGRGPLGRSAAHGVVRVTGGDPVSLHHGTDGYRRKHKEDTG